MEAALAHARARLSGSSRGGAMSHPVETPYIGVAAIIIVSSGAITGKARGVPGADGGLTAAQLLAWTTSLAPISRTKTEHVQHLRPRDRSRAEGARTEIECRVLLGKGINLNTVVGVKVA